MQSNRRSAHFLKLADVSINITFKTCIREHLIHQPKLSRLVRTYFRAARDEFKRALLGNIAP